MEMGIGRNAGVGNAGRIQFCEHQFLKMDQDVSHGKFTELA